MTSPRDPHSQAPIGDPMSTGPRMGDPTDERPTEMLAGPARSASRTAGHRRIPGDSKDPRRQAKVTKRGKGPTGRRRKDIIRVAEYDTYVIWHSLPAILRGQPAKDLRRMGFADPVTLDLLAIPHQRAFAKRFKVNPATLSEWNIRPDLMRRVTKARDTWARKLTSNVYSALYKGIILERDASRVKLWMQLVEGYVEKTRNEHSGPNGASLFQDLGQVSDQELDRRIQETVKRMGE